jgi:ribosomal protein S18 acetylase RimI-like enzyme
MVSLGIDLVKDEAQRALLFALAREVFGGVPGWSDRRTLDVLEEDVVLVAHDAGVVAGYVALHESPPAVVIDQVLVTEPAVAAEIGRRLVGFAEGYAIARRAARLEIVVEPDNRPARELYGSMGFRPRAAGRLELELGPQS